MLFIVALDISVLGIAMLWHGLTMNSSPLFWFGFIVMLIGNGLVLLNRRLNTEDVKLR